ncbi:MAG: rSAM-modified peptide [bacterium]|nr:rSAM-modified peptide [bacterium]
MKIKKSRRKLVLKKDTVANLSDEELNNLKGGTRTRIYTSLCTDQHSRCIE